MAEYIERAALLAIVGKMPLGWEYGRAVSDVYDIINAAPAADVVPAPRWISVADDLPDPCTPVLFSRENKYNAKCVEIGFYVGDGRWSKGGWYSKKPTHWMPLPDPPEVIGANE